MTHTNDYNKVIDIALWKAFSYAKNTKESSGGNRFTYYIKEYLINPYFKDIDLYLAQNKLWHTKGAISKVETLCRKMGFIRFIVL